MSLKPRLTRRCLFSLPVSLRALSQQPATNAPQIHSPVMDVASALKEASFDPAQSWRVRDLSLVREDVKIYLTDGILVLSRPIGGRRMGAVFLGEMEGGDAELIVLPPTAGERQCLARFTESPNLSVHFRSAMFLFSDQTASEIEAWLKENPDREAPEMGVLAADRFSGTLRNLAASFQARLVQDLAGGVKPSHGLFFAAIGNSPLGNFDVVYDPQAFDQVVVGQLLNKEGRGHYNVWTSFPSRRVRKDPSAAPPSREFVIESVAIDAALGTDLRLSATTKLGIQVPAGGMREVRNALAFDISSRVRIRGATVDGRAVQVLQRESLRSTLLRGSENDVFLLALDSHLGEGKHEVEIQHEGEVVVPSGNGVYFVSARGTWYPHHGLQFAPYDLTFRYPKSLTVVATGELVSEKEDGEQRITRRRSNTPLRIAGFNLGQYKRSVVSRGGITVEVYANRAVEAALLPHSQPILLPPPPSAGMGGRQRQNPVPPLIVPSAPPDPARLINSLAHEVAEAMEFLSERLGPPPVKTLAVSPIPGTFGQGFPGLIYLSTLAYLPASQRPKFAATGIDQVFFSNILVAHEVAHQWWGNIVSTTGYRDEWMMEALANYSALLLLERKRGARAVDEVLDRYREHLLMKPVSGQTIDAAGPVRFGARLETSESPGAYRVLIYEKGTWVMHMLRRRLGDAAFFAALKEVGVRFARGRITTEEFREIVARHQPKDCPDPKLELFFDTYLEGTGIPSLRLQSKQLRKARGLVLALELEQSDVPDTFSVDVPVELDFGRGKVERRWIRTDGPRTPVEWTLPVPPVKVALDPRNSLLAIKRG